jgi:D-glycero-alpha-D-manno-heptose 1-phosphate guanylyltransferase
MPELHAIDAVILAGGLGKRMRGTVDDRPKPLAMIRDRPFLDILLDDLTRQGLRRFILCVGHLRDQIVAHLRSRTDAEFLFSEESAPLGTGGAIRHAAPLVRSDPFLALNGDSLCRIDYERFLAFHRERNSTASIAVAAARGRTDGGTVELTDDARVVRFREKAPGKSARPAYINAGVYLLRRDLPTLWRQSDPFSLEHDVFPELVGKESCYGYVVDTEVFDIGTPERYFEAQSKL